MDDQILVCELDGVADTLKESKSLLDSEVLFVAKTVDGRSIHVFHRQVQIAIAGYTAIEQAGDQWMLESCENLALLTEPFAEEAGRKREVDKLDGDLLLELAIGAMGQIDGTHASAA